MRVKTYQDGSLGFILFTICKRYLNFLKVKVLNMESDAFPKPPFSTSLVTSLQFLITAMAHLTNISLLFFFGGKISRTGCHLEVWDIFTYIMLMINYYLTALRTVRCIDI